MLHVPSNSNPNILLNERGLTLLKKKIYIRGQKDFKPSSIKPSRLINAGDENFFLF